MLRHVPTASAQAPSGTTASTGMRRCRELWMRTASRSSGLPILPRTWCCPGSPLRTNHWYGSSAYQELLLTGDAAHYPGDESIGALLGDTVKKVDGSDAQLIMEGNAGSDLLYVPSKNPELVRQTLALLAQLDYIGGIFVDDV